MEKIEELLCTNELFRFFVRSNFPDVKVDNDSCDQINIDFSNYLRNRCTGKQLSNFVPESEIQVILNLKHPLMMKGFNPAFAFHFTEFIDEQKKKITQDVIEHTNEPAKSQK